MTALERDFKQISEICSQIEAHNNIFKTALVKLAIVLQEDKYRLHSAVITFLDCDDKKEEKRNYGELLLTKKYLEPKKICKILKELVENKTFTIEGFPPLEAIGSFGHLEFVPSKRGFGYLKSDWPTRYVEYRMAGANIPLPRNPLGVPDLPLYPDGNKAVIDFLNLRSASAERFILVQIPDYRVRITNLSISGNKIKLEIDSKNINSNLLATKFYGEYGSGERGLQVMHSPNLSFINNLVEYEFKLEPKYISVAVINVNTGDILDFRRFSFGWSVQEGVTIERDGLEIGEIIRRGENVAVEFKQDLTNTEKILVTVVAFANTIGGLILIGVADNGRIIGFQAKDREQITNLITSNIEPNLEFEVNIAEIDGKPITIIEIPEGENPPYSHRQLGVFVRRGATNRHATRTDLDEIRAKKKSMIGGYSY